MNTALFLDEDAYLNECFVCDVCKGDFCRKDGWITEPYGSVKKNQICGKCAETVVDRLNKSLHEKES